MNRCLCGSNCPDKDFRTRSATSLKVADGTVLHVADAVISFVMDVMRCVDL